jgi:ribosomal protein S18 acetylase RimI-like enzyme
MAQVGGGRCSRGETRYTNQSGAETRDTGLEEGSDISVPRDTLRVTTCDTDETLAAASALFDQYRHHYGEPPDGDGRTLGWLTDMVQSRMLTVYTASVDSSADAPPIGLATGHAIPASLIMGRFWQLRDLYVLPGSRRQGAGAALVVAVREAALAAGATRLSLATELDNQAALGLYQRLGFRPVEGLVSLSLNLAPNAIRA